MLLNESAAMLDPALDASVASGVAPETVSVHENGGDELHGNDAVLTLLAEAGEAGLTWREFDARSGWDHHGRSSGALSSLHARGTISRLTERRDRCSVYVLNENVAGRETAPHGNSSPSRVPVKEMEALTVRNEKLFDALDNLAHAAGFAKHRHLFVEEAETCFLCIAREVVESEKAAREAAA